MVGRKTIIMMLWLALALACNATSLVYMSPDRYMGDDMTNINRNFSNLLVGVNVAVTNARLVDSPSNYFALVGLEVIGCVSNAGTEADPRAMALVWTSFWFDAVSPSNYFALDGQTLRYCDTNGAGGVSVSYSNLFQGGSSTGSVVGSGSSSTSEFLSAAGTFQALPAGSGGGGGAQTNAVNDWIADQYFQASIYFRQSISIRSAWNASSFEMGYNPDVDNQSIGIGNGIYSHNYSVAIVQDIYGSGYAKDHACLFSVGDGVAVDFANALGAGAKAYGYTPYWYYGAEAFGAQSLAETGTVSIGAGAGKFISGGSLVNSCGSSNIYIGAYSHGDPHGIHQYVIGHASSNGVSDSFLIGPEDSHWFRAGRCTNTLYGLASYTATKDESGAWVFYWHGSNGVMNCITNVSEYGHP